MNMYKTSSLLSIVRIHRRLLVVPVNISRSKKFMLAVKIESRNGLMYKHLPFPPFGEEKLMRLRAYARIAEVQILSMT